MKVVLGSCQNRQKKRLFQFGIETVIGRFFNLGADNRLAAAGLVQQLAILALD